MKTVSESQLIEDGTSQNGGDDDDLHDEHDDYEDNDVNGDDNDDDYDYFGKEMSNCWTLILHFETKLEIWEKATFWVQRRPSHCSQDKL